MELTAVQYTTTKNISGPSSPLPRITKLNAINQQNVEVEKINNTTLYTVNIRSSTNQLS